jgi:ubiquinone biosynthesis protein
VRVPFVRTEISTSRVLVMQRVRGVSVDQLEGRPGLAVPREEIARRLLASFLDQIIRAGAYHADPHPGNILVDDDGTIWLIDFGAVGYLDRATLESFQMMVLGVTTDEVSLLARSVIRLAGSPGTVDRDALEADLGSLLGAQARAGGFDPRSLAEVVAVMRRYDLVPPPSLTTLSRSLLTLEGTLRVLDPDFDLAHETMQVIGSQTAAEEDLWGRVQRELLRSVPALRSLPEHAETIAQQLESGRLTLNVRHLGDDEAVIDAWIDRVLFTLIGCAGLISSAALVLAAGTGDSTIAIVVRSIGFVGLFVASTMVMRITARVLRRHPD